MPYKAKKPCPHPGCRELTNGGYCDKHRREDNARYESQARDKTVKAFYSTARWGRVRKIQLGRESMCRHCRERGVLVEASHVDHIVEIADGGDPWDLDNLQSLCKSCHTRKTNHSRISRERNGAVVVERPKSMWETGDYKF